MSSEQATVPVQCLPAREYLSVSYIKSMLHGFVYEYETPKIVTIHSISSKSERRSRVGNADRLLSSRVDVPSDSSSDPHLWHRLSDDS